MNFRVWGERGAREGRGEESEWEREERAVSVRESGLNAMGPKTVENRFNRSDRLSRPVRPVRVELPQILLKSVSLMVCGANDRH